MAVTVGIRRMAHRLVLKLVREQAAELAVDDALLVTEELQRAGSHALGALGGVAHDEHRLARAQGLFLDTAGIREDEAGALGPLELGVGVPLAHGGAQGIDAQGVDAGVSGDPDPGLGLAITEQVLLAGFRGGEGVLAHDVDRLAIELLLPGAEDDVRAKVHLDMPHRDLQVETCECRDEACRGVAVEQENVALLVLEDGFELDQYVARHVEQRLIRLHDRKVMVGIHVEDAQLLVEHLGELTGHGHDGIELILARL